MVELNQIVPGSSPGITVGVVSWMATINNCLVKECALKLLGTKRSLA